MADTQAGHGVSVLIDAMTPEERDKTLADLLRQQQTAGGDDTRKIEDANLLLRLRPKVRVTTYIPLARRYAERDQDRKVWDAGIIDPLADEDIPGRPQIVRVVTIPEGEVLFERQQVAGLPTASEPVHLTLPPAGQPATGPAAPGPATDDFDAGGPTPTTVPVASEVLDELMARLSDLEAENTRLRAERDPAAGEPETPGAKAADRRRGKPVREPAPGARDAETTAADDAKAGATEGS